MKNHTYQHGLRCRSLRLEPLESRELLSATSNDWYTLCDFTGCEPTAAEQELLELTNRMRMNPQAEFSRLILECNPDVDQTINGHWNDEFFSAYTKLITDACKERYPALDASTLNNFLTEWSSLSGTSPLAFNTTLQSVASNYTQYMIDNPASIIGDFSHNPHLKSDLGGAFCYYGENVYATSDYSTGYSLVEFVHAAFAIDWGNEQHEHRDNIMNPQYSELGVSVKSTQIQGTTKYYSTMDYGTSNVCGADSNGAYLLGVVYSDSGTTPFYNAGEGLRDVTLVIRRTDNPSQYVSIDSMAEGGYQLYLANGSYTITAAQGPNYGGTVTKSFTIDGSNVKIDFTTGDYSAGVPLLDLGQGLYYDYGASVNYYEGTQTPIRLIPNVSITSKKTILAAEITADSATVSQGDILNISGEAGLTCTKSGNTWHISGEASVETYQQILSSLTWVNLDDNISLDTRLIDVKVTNDGHTWSNQATITLNIVPRSPVLTIESTKCYEGDGTTSVEFIAHLNEAPKETVSFQYHTAEGTLRFSAGESTGVEETTGKITFYAGETSKNFSVTIYGDYEAQKVNGIANTLYNVSDDLYFLLKLDEINGLIFRNEEIRATMIDDDTPCRMIQNTLWTLPNAQQFETEYGTQRFLYAVESQTAGVATWSVDGNVPDGFSLSIYRNAYSPTPLSGVIYNSTATGLQVQWTLEAGVKYVVKIEKSGDTETISNQTLRILEISTDNVIMIDPLWEDFPDDEKLLAVNANGDQFQFEIGDQLWNIPFDDYTMKTADNSAKLRFDFDGGDGIFTQPGTSTGSNNTLRLTTSTLTGFYEGFGDIEIIGNNNLEELLFEGTDGDDILQFQNGSGTFVTYANNEVLKRTYTFSDVTYARFTAGISGKDSAVLYDSANDDTVETSELSTELLGGGYSITTENFPSLDVNMTNGGQDQVNLKNNLESIKLFLLDNGAILSGTLDKIDANRLQDEAIMFTIRGYALLENSESDVVLDTVYVSTSLYNTTEYEAEVGTLRTFNTNSNRGNQLNNVRNIVFYGAVEPDEDRFSLAADDGCQWKINPDNQTRSLVKKINGNDWSVVLPMNWKRFSSSIVLPYESDSVQFNESSEQETTSSDVAALVLPSVSVENSLSGTYDLPLWESDMSSVERRGRINRALFADIDMVLDTVLN